MQIEITGTHYVWNGFAPYRAVGRGRPFIKTRAEHLAYLRRNNYEEVGNDSSMAPPDRQASEAEWAQSQAPKNREMQESCAELERISRHLEP